MNERLTRRVLVNQNVRAIRNLSVCFYLLPRKTACDEKFVYISLPVALSCAALLPFFSFAYFGFFFLFVFFPCANDAMVSGAPLAVHSSSPRSCSLCGCARGVEYAVGVVVVVVVPGREAVVLPRGCGASRL